MCQVLKSELFEWVELIWELSETQDALPVEVLFGEKKATY